MSWQAYIDRMTGSGVEMAGIFGKNGALWAATGNFSPTPEEVSYLATAIDKKDTNIFTTGVKLAGSDWTVIRLEGDMLILKGKRNENCKQNMIIAASNQALIMGANVDEKVPAGTVRISVEGIRDYLKSNQY